LVVLMQTLLWLIFTDDFPAILFRDTRLTAALVLGSSVLSPSATFVPSIMLTATLIHFAISIVYTAFVAALTARLDATRALLAGLGFGIVLYLLNLYGFTAIFPWFVQARGWITLITHGLFGVTAVLVCRWLYISNVRSGPDGH
ncbi:MAG: sodium:proline symporter, partial [Betaproteobacteria bacterium]|nr:sodium:proline symporter [Betaproteobacteria bacterium]